MNAVATRMASAHGNRCAMQVASLARRGMQTSLCAPKGIYRRNAGSQRNTSSSNSVARARSLVTLAVADVEIPNPPVGEDVAIRSTGNQYGMARNPCMRKLLGQLPRLSWLSWCLNTMLPAPTPLAGKVKHCVKLRTNRKYREAAGRVMITGTIPIWEIAGSGSRDVPVEVRVLFLADWVNAEVEGVHAAQTIRVTEPVMKRLTGLETVSGVHAVAEVEVPGETDLCNVNWPVRRLLVLEQLQDPGNLGTLLRTAQAFGWDSLYLLPGCCDPFNEKVIRASRGASFRLRRGSGTWQELKQIISTHNLQCLAAEPDPDAKLGSKTGVAPDGPEMAPDGKHAGTCLVLGSEGQGLSEESLQACAAVSLPMPGEMESLNVGVAGGILMYLLGTGANDLLNFGRQPET